MIQLPLTVYDNARTKMTGLNGETFDCAPLHLNSEIENLLASRNEQ